MELKLNDKIEEVSNLTERRKHIREFLDKCALYGIVVNAGLSEVRLKAKDEKLAEYIKEYYEKELENIDKKLNELLK